MEDFFPLCFKKTDDQIRRGLSVVESEKLNGKYNVTLNPRKIPDRDPKYNMTLVWDLDQTLISADGIDDEDEDDIFTELVIRPHATEVLEILRRNLDVEFIIWTAGTQGHAERVVGSFPSMKFDHIIARDSSWYKDRNPVKHLGLLARAGNRGYDSMILIDDRMDIGKEHPENLLIVPPYYPKKCCAADDKTLLYLVNIIQRAINKFRATVEDPTRPAFSSYLFSPLAEKCVEDGKHYFGVKCFESKEELMSRIKAFRRVI